ncbi:MAG: hypothetical protein ACYTBS_13740, partial [Planctomycetota bacterium]
MDSICEKIRQQIPELIGTGLSAEKAVELEQHRSQCPACNEYFEALEADDRLLCEFARAMQTSVARLENVAMDQLGRRPSGGMIQTASTEAGILGGRVARVAAAVLIVTAILVGAVMLRSSGEKPVEIVEQPDESGTLAAEAPKQEEPDLAAITEAELQEIQRMISASDVAGLKMILNSGQPRSKIAAANFLATTGDARLIGDLAQLAAEWQGDATRNPFAAAIAEIVTSLQEQQSEAGEDQEDETVAETTTAKSADEVGCRGVVVDEQGRAIPEASVLLYHNRSKWGLGNRILEETVSAADGTFVCREAVEFNPVKQRSYERDRYMDTYILMATHPDYAFGWRNITQGSQQDTYRIVLTDPTSLTTTVTDHDGNPLAGVRLSPSSVGDGESPKAVFRDYLILPADVGLTPGATDAEGQVVITNVPDTHYSLRATLEGYAEGHGSQSGNIIRLSKGASISGWVLAEGNKPVAGATVSFKPDRWYHHFLAVTDNEGYFHLEDLPAKGWNRAWDSSKSASGSYTVTIKHEQCAAQPTDVTLLPGQSIDDFLIEASGETTLVECLVLESGTNMPMSGAGISLSNKIGEIEGRSDPSGIFAVRVLPGPVSLSFRAAPDGVYFLGDYGTPESRLRFTATGEKMAVTLKAPPIAGLLRRVPGIVLGPDGMAQGEGETVVYPGRQKIGTSTASNRARPAGVDDDGRFELREVAAGCKLPTYAATTDHAFAATDVFEIPDDPDWSGYLAINLRATQSALVVVRDEDGNVVRDRQLRIEPMVEGEWIWGADRQGRTDENG